MNLSCHSCQADLSNLEGDIFFLFQKGTNTTLNTQVISIDTTKRGNTITDLKLLCRSCTDDSFDVLCSLKEFIENGDKFHENALRESSMHAPYWSPGAITFLESLLLVRENLYWGESADYVYNREPYWLDEGFNSEQDYHMEINGRTKDDMYTEYFLDIIHYKRFFKLFLSVAQEEGRIRTERKLATTKQGNRTKSNLSDSMYVIHALDDVLIDKISEWLDKALIRNDQSNHYRTLLSLVLNEYNMVEEYHKTLEDAFSTVQKFLSRYLKAYENVEIDLDYVHKEQLKERLDRLTGNWLD